MGTDNGSNGGGWWPFGKDAPSIAKAITIIGIPGVIALYLTWMGAQILPRLQQDVQLNRAEIQKQEELLRQHLQDQRDTFRVMLRICANTAKTDQERGACFDAK